MSKDNYYIVIDWGYEESEVFMFICYVDDDGDIEKIECIGGLYD